MPRVLVVDDSPTIRRVVRRTLAQAGFDVSVATDGRDGLDVVQREVPDLVLVDFVMPNMNGLRFVQAMREVDNLERVPVVLMSAKADKIGDGFLAQTGAIDAIHKPFSPEALLTVTEHALSRAADTEPPPSIVTLDPDRMSTVPPSAGPDDAPPTETTPVVLGEASAAIAWKLASLVAELAPETDPTRLAETIELAMEPQELFERVIELSGLIPGLNGEVALSGQMEHVPLGEVLQLLTQQQQTGILEVAKRPSRSERAITVCLREGRVQLALGRVHEQEFKIGRYLLRESLIEREDLERILKNRQSDRGLLGTQLVKLGYISVEELRTVLVHQTSELIYEALRWRRGDFRFLRFASRPEAEDASLGLPVASILMEGLRRVDEWRLIAEQIREFDDVPRRDEEALRTVDQSRFQGEERQVLEMIDGTRTIREIIDSTKLSSFDACKVLFQMATSRLIRLD